MQEEIEHKTVNFAISTVKLSARTLLKGAQFFLRQYDKSASQGKQSMNRLIRQNRGVTNLEIEKTGINNRIESLERRIQEAEAAEVNEMVRTAKVTPEQLAALLRQSATSTPTPAALSAVGATFNKEESDNEDDE